MYRATTDDNGLLHNIFRTNEEENRTGPENQAIFFIYI